MFRSSHRGVVAVAAGALAALIVLTAAFALGPQLLDPIPPHIPQSPATVALEEIASGLNAPVKGTFAPGDHKHLFVIEQTGPAWVIDVSPGKDDDGTPHLFADFTSIVTPLGCFIGYDERGLLGIAFHPDYRHNGLLYTFTSETGAGTGGCFGQASVTAPPNHESVIREWRVGDVKADHPTVIMSSSRELLRLPQPQFNHNGGDIAFGPDGMLYIATGDGGAADDQGVGHVPGGNAQDLGSLYGNILRIDVDGRAVAGAYSIPTGNPFIGVPGARGEIFAYGFRNPYRMSFDSKTGALYVADVGQNDIEEIDVVTAGGNYGWPIKEGTFVFDNNGATPGFVTGDPSPPGLIDPIAEYDHWLDQTRTRTATEGIAIVGGHVYRGSHMKDKGVRKYYVFGDYSRRFAQPEGRLFVLDDANQVTELTIAGRSTLGLAVLGFAEDSKGELYLLANVTGLVGGAGFPSVPTNTGVVLKLTRP